MFEAWTRPELFRRWWVPKSTGVSLFSCEMDVRTGGGYRLELGRDAAKPMAFFGRYLKVVPPRRLVWTNEESADSSLTTATFEEVGEGRTRLSLHELYPSKEALDRAIAGMEGGMSETLDQLDELLENLGAGAAPS